MDAARRDRNDCYSDVWKKVETTGGVDRHRRLGGSKLFGGQGLLAYNEGEVGRGYDCGVVFFVDGDDEGGFAGRGRLRPRLWPTGSGVW